MPERHVGVHARCCLCDASFQPLYRRPKIRERLDLVACKLRRNIRRLSGL